MNFLSEFSVSNCVCKFRFTISHTPRKQLVTADTLSQAPPQTLSITDSQPQDDCDAYVAMTIDSLPATESKLQQIRDALKKDDVCQQLMQFSSNGWPQRVSGQLKNTYQFHLN